jgi:arylsulfatase A-like enzyme
MFAALRKALTHAAEEPGLWRDLALAMLLGIGFGCVFVAIGLGNSQQLLNPRIAAWLTDQPVLSAALRWKFIGFVVAHIVLHLAFGVIAWLLALASRGALAFARLRRRHWLFLWFLVLSAWVLLYNAAAFPDSVAAQKFCCQLLPHEFFVTVTGMLTGVAGAVVLFIVYRCAMPTPRARSIGLRIGIYGVLLLSAFGVWRWVSQEARANSDQGSPPRPNYIIIGIDSLRADFIGASGAEPGVTPNIDGFLEGGVVFTDAITPLGRTFPAWVSILTGQAPSTTGVRENLFKVEQPALDASIAHRFRAEGYRTVYGTDEVRFSNVDQRFGFDQVVGPPMGVTDFLLGSVNDTPLSNLIANTWLGHALFPNTYANRAAATTYRPSSFIEQLADAIDDDAVPTFLAVHLGLPHWPFRWATTVESDFSRLVDTRYQYSAAVIAADRQFGELIAMLERRGLLRNAVVIVLSDHGEGLGMRRDNLLHAKAAKQAVGALSISTWGHGNSVLSPGQYSVVLGVRGFGRSALPQRGSHATIDAPASLEDIAPTLAGFAKLDGLVGEGVDWTPQLRQAAPVTDAHLARVRITESGYIVGFGDHGEVDAEHVASNAVQKYEISGTDGRVTVRKASLAALLREKERAALGRDWTLAAIPAQERMRYIAVQRTSGEVRELTESPDAADPILPLWQALQHRYGSELNLQAGVEGK